MASEYLCGAVSCNDEVSTHLDERRNMSEHVVSAFGSIFVHVETVPTARGWSRLRGLRADLLTNVSRLGNIPI